MMTAKEVLDQLEAFGDERTKNTLMNHGAREPLFGVKVSDLKKILKQTKKNHALSLELYSTGNSDAMYLAGLMADEKQKAKVINPGTVLDKEDPGDDMQARIRYQHVYAAIQCLRLLSNESPIAVYCENHEDILVEETANIFTGIQVKTKQFIGIPFKTSDGDFKKSLARFARLEEKFPNCFTGYSLVTNHSFWANKDDDIKNPEYLANYIKKRIS